MSLVDQIFKNKIANQSKLIAYGFKRSNPGLKFVTILPDSKFKMTIVIGKNNLITTLVVDPITNTPYTLHLSNSNVGGFVEGVRLDYQTVLKSIAEHCFDTEIFKNPQTKQLIEYVRKRYGDELEFLWQKSPNNAIWRRPDTQKWYATILTMDTHKLGVKNGHVDEIIDLRIQPEKMADLVDNYQYFPGWHMNKKNWYTIVLDGSVPFSELVERVDNSRSMNLTK